MAMYRPTIQFNKYQLPEPFEITLSGIEYHITVSYNSFNDRLYLTIADENDEDLVTNEKLVAQEALFASVNDVNLPREDLVLMDETGKETTVNFANINDGMYITIDVTFKGEMDPGNTDDGLFNPDGDEANMGSDPDESDEPIPDDDLDGMDDLAEIRGDG